MQLNYNQMLKNDETRAIATDDYMARIEQLEHESSKDAVHLNAMRDEITHNRSTIMDLEALVAIAAKPVVPRAPDIVLIEDVAEGFSAALGTVQEACGHIAERGVNLGKPCMRPRENPERKHARGRHRY